MIRHDNIPADDPSVDVRGRLPGRDQHRGNLRTVKQWLSVTDTTGDEEDGTRQIIKDAVEPAQVSPTAKGNSQSACGGLGGQRCARPTASRHVIPFGHLLLVVARCRAGVPTPAIHPTQREPSSLLMPAKKSASARLGGHGNASPTGRRLPRQQLPQPRISPRRAVVPHRGP